MKSTKRSLISYMACRRHDWAARRDADLGRRRSDRHEKGLRHLVRNRPRDAERGRLLWPTLCVPRKARCPCENPLVVRRRPVPLLSSAGGRTIYVASRNERRGVFVLSPISDVARGDRLAKTCEEITSAALGVIDKKVRECRKRQHEMAVHAIHIAYNLMHGANA